MAQVWHCHPRDAGAEGTGTAEDPFNGWPTGLEWTQLLAGDILDAGGHTYLGPHHSGNGAYRVERGVEVRDFVIDMDHTPEITGLQFRTYQGTDVTGVTLRRGTVKNCGRAGTANPANALHTYIGGVTNTTEHGSRVIQCLLDGARGGTLGSDVVQHRGADMQFTETVFRNAGRDLLYAEGDRLMVLRCLFEGDSLDVVGDCIQTNARANGTRIENNWLEHNGNGTNQGILVSGQPADLYLVRRNVVLQMHPPTAVGLYGIAVQNAGEAIGNYVEGFWDNFQVRDAATVAFNISANPVRHGIVISGDTSEPIVANNTVLGAVNGVWCDSLAVPVVVNNWLVGYSDFGLQLEVIDNFHGWNMFSSNAPGSVAIALDNVEQALGTDDFKNDLTVAVTRPARPVWKERKTGGVDITFPRWLVATYPIPDEVKERAIYLSGFFDAYGRPAHPVRPDIGALQAPWMALATGRVR